MSDDGPTNNSTTATNFQGLIIPNVASCLLDMLGMELVYALPGLFMTDVRNPCIHSFTVVYLDDICIYSKSPQENVNNLFRKKY